MVAIEHSNSHPGELARETGGEQVAEYINLDERRLSHQKSADDCNEGQLDKWES